MRTFCKSLVPVFVMFFALAFFDTGISVDNVVGKSFRGGKSFKM